MAQLIRDKDARRSALTVADEKVAAATLQSATQRPVQVAARAAVRTAGQKTVQLVPRKTTAAGSVEQEDGGDPLHRLPLRAVAPEQPHRGDLTEPPACVRLLRASTTRTGRGSRSAIPAPVSSCDA